MYLYELEFTDDEWIEIEAMNFMGFEPTKGVPMYRPQWMALAYTCLGKAQRVEEGAYGLAEDALDDPHDEIWAAQLRGIADKILTKFKPGDGQL